MRASGPDTLATQGPNSPPADMDPALAVLVERRRRAKTLPPYLARTTDEIRTALARMLSVEAPEAAITSVARLGGGASKEQFVFGLRRPRSSTPEAEQRYVLRADPQCPIIETDCRREFEILNAMVDRITPATTDRERQITRDTFGIDDGWPVFCEEFKQWVIEDRFSMGRPAFEKVGATFVADVTPWESMKIRILNGGHAVLAYAAGLLDVHFVHEAMEHPLVRAFFDKIEIEEIVPTVGPVPGTDLLDYYRLIARRFANPKIGDTIRRLCFDGSNRQPKFIVPVIADRLKAGRGFAGLALESALWCRYCYGVSDSGKAIAANDPDWERLQQNAWAAKENPLAWLQMKDIYGDVAAHPAFVAAFQSALQRVWSQGAAAAIKAYVTPPQLAASA